MAEQFDLYEPLAGPVGGARNMGGTKQVAYCAPIGHFETIAELPAAPTELGEFAAIEADHVFDTGHNWIEVYCTLDKGEINDEPNGETDGRSFTSKASLFVPGAEKEKFGFANAANNDKWIVLIPMPDGAVRQIGTKDFFAEMLFKFGSATNKGGVRGFMIDIEAVGPDLIVYEGEITLTPAV